MSNPLRPSGLLTCQASLSMECSRQEYWSGLPFPSPGGLPHPGLNPCLLHWQLGSLPLTPRGKQFAAGHSLLGFPGGSDGKESACKAGDPGSIATHSSIVGESRGQRSLEGYIVHGVAKGRTLLKQLIHTHTHTHRVYYNQFIVILGCVTWDLSYWFIFKFFLVSSISDPPWNDGRNWLWSWWNSLSGGMDSRRHDNNSTPCAPGLRKCKYLHRGVTWW